MKIESNIEASMGTMSEGIKRDMIEIAKEFLVELLQHAFPLGKTRIIRRVVGN